MCCFLGDLCKVVNWTVPVAVSCEATRTHSVSQTLWPEHCIVNTTSAEISRNIVTGEEDAFFPTNRNNCHVWLLKLLYFYKRSKNVHTFKKGYWIETVCLFGFNVAFKHLRSHREGACL